MAMYAPLHNQQYATQMIAHLAKDAWALKTLLVTHLYAQKAATAISISQLPLSIGAHTKMEWSMPLSTIRHSQLL